MEFLLSAFLPDEAEGRFLHTTNPIAETATPVEPVIEMVIHRRASNSAAPTTLSTVQAERRPAFATTTTSS